MEDKRTEVTAEQIAAYFQLAASLIDGVPAHFVFNMDEMGHQEWADRQTRTCFVPVYHEHDHVAYPVSRTGKRITLVACIAADGSYTKPLIVIPRKTIDEDLFLTGLTAEKVELYSQAKGYIDTQIFEAWLENTLVVEVEKRREAHGYTGPAILAMDNCTAHASPTIDALFQAHGIVPLPLPPHSSNQVQALDLCIFGVTKRHIMRINRMETLNIQSKHIAQVVCGFFAAATPVNIVQSFRNAGIGLIVQDGRLLCKIDPSQARCLLKPLPNLIPAPEEMTEDAQEDLEMEIYVQECADAIEDIEGAQTE
jgi:hypothetical protein